MQVYQTRVIEERAELELKISKLFEFISGPLYKTLNQDEQNRLVLQHSAMKVYSEILAERIAHFKI